MKAAVPPVTEAQAATLQVALNKLVILPNLVTYFSDTKDRAKERQAFQQNAFTWNLNPNSSSAGVIMGF